MIDRRNSRGAWSRGASFPVVSKAGFCALVGSPRIEFRVDDDRGGGRVMARAMVSFSPVREESLKSYPPNAEVCVNEDAGPSPCEGKSAIPYD